MVPSKKQNIVVITCQGGGCHVSVCQALKQYVKTPYRVVVKDLFIDIFGKLDISRIISFNTMGSTDIYNTLIYKNSLKPTVPVLTMVAFKLIRIAQPLIEQIVFLYLKKQNPDLIISVIPIFNGIFESVAQKMDVPFLLIPLDLDIQSVFLNDIEKPTYKKSYCTLPFDDIFMGHKKRTKLPFAPDHVFVTGYPLRTEFLKTYDKSKVKNELGLPTNKPIVTILMGGVGSEVTRQAYEKLCSMKIPLHAIVCLGKNETLAKEIENISIPNTLSRSLFGYTNAIAQLMAASDVLVTKPGPGSICEALYLNIPMIVDNSCGTLFWEQFHLEFVRKNEFGTIMDSIDELPELLTKYLNDSDYYQRVKENLIRFEKKKFDQHIQDVVSSILH